jgi:hypothetical protein
MRTLILILVVVLAVFGSGCRARATRSDDAGPPRPDPASLTPPRREMVSIQGGQFLGSDMWCFEGTTTVKYPDDPKNAPKDRVPLSVPSFAIDKSVVQCGELERCFAAGACENTYKAALYTCRHGVAVASLKTATQFCAWRGMQLPSWFQWQRAMRGRDGWVYPRGLTWEDSYDHDPGIPGRGRPYLSPDGVEYFMTRGDLNASLELELTRDLDCMRKTNPEAGDRRLPVSVLLDYDQLNIVLVTEPDPELSRDQFRCVDNAPTP